MKKDKKTAVTAEPLMLCDRLDFVLHEEYRLLRTNIKFSLADEKSYHAIGVVSSVKGEAKTTTAINLAFTLAENGDKICLVEADMRLPTIRKKLKCEPHIGLSEYLTGQAKLEEIISTVQFEKCELPIIQAGTIPPNPAELLSSARMTKLLEELGREYAYIIVDLPPVTLVSDAIILGDRLDGLVMVVAQPICTKKLLKESMRQLLLARIRVLGFVRTFSTDQGFGYSKYGKKRYKYRRGYNYHYSRSSYAYGYGASSSSKKAGKPEEKTKKQ